MNLQQTIQKLLNAGITPTAVSYTRFSSDNQRDESIDAQQRAIRDFAKTNKIIITHEYVDRAKSATSDDREQFQQMIRDAGAHEFQFVIVHKLDRFSRNRADSFGYRVELKKQGVMLISVIEQFDSDTPEGAFMEGIIELMAEFYSKNLSREVMKGLKENALSAKFNGGKPPYGYDVNPETQKYIINEEEAAAVKLIFSMVAGHYSYGEILTKLHKDGYRTKLSNPFKRNSIYEILRNPRYTGKYIYMRVAPKDNLTQLRNNHSFNPDPIIVPDGIPVIIDQETFDQVQHILDTRKHKHKLHRSSYLLSGKITCGNCGSAYVGERLRRKSGSYYYSYRCANRKNKVGKQCDTGNVHCDYLDSAAIVMISNMVFNEQLIPMLLAKYNEAVARADSETTRAIAKISKKISGVDSAIANIITAIEVSGSTALIARLKDLETQRAELVQQQERLKEAAAVQSIDADQMSTLIARAKAMLSDKDNSATQRLIDMFIEGVEVFNDRIDIKINAAPFISKSNYTRFIESIPRHPLK